jgi:hypothetical protein
MAFVLCACSGESNDATNSQPGTDGGTETSTPDDSGASDVLTEVAEDGPAQTFGVPFCSELGVDNVLPHTTNIANEFGKTVIGDCRVILLLLPLTSQESSVWLQNTATWTGAFFGCPGSGAPPTSFGPAQTPQNPALSQSDVDVLVEHFATATEQWLTLSPAQSQVLRDELGAVAALSVNVPISEHVLSLCTDSGVPDAGSDASSDAGADADTDAEAGP